MDLRDIYRRSGLNLFNKELIMGKTRKEFLVQEIKDITRLIEESRKNKNKDVDSYRKQLIKLILELDALGRDTKDAEDSE